jgi:hypothetical protein
VERQARRGVVVVTIQRIDREWNGNKFHTYKIDGKPAVGVTTALKGIPKDALVPWAAKEVATYVVDNIYDVKRMLDSGGRQPTIDFLKGIPHQKRDTAAVRGTQVHALAERYIRGEEVEVPDDILAYVEGYASFINDWRPVSVHEELVVASRKHMYAGTLDSIQLIPEVGLTLVDYKTSRGVYGEVALQVAAYRYADVYLDGDGAEQPMPAVEETKVLHIQPGTYDLIPLKADEEAFQNYLKAQANYLANVQSKKLDKLLGEPMTRPGDAA